MHRPGLRWASGLALLLAAQASALAPIEGRRTSTASRGLKPAGELLEIRPVEAGSPTLIAGQPKLFLDARRALGRGRAAEALRVLAGSRPDGLLADREALLKGDALLALGRTEDAKQAYLFALEGARVRSVGVAAARALAGLFHTQKDHESELTCLEALLSDPSVARRASLMLQRAQALRAAGKGAEAAEMAWRIMQEHPASAVAGPASSLLLELKRQGARIPVASTKVELMRIRNLVAAGEFRSAEQEIARLEKDTPKLSLAITLARADMYAKRRMKQEEFTTLLPLAQGAGLDDDDAAEVLSRLGKLALSRDDYSTAAQMFTELERRFPSSNLNEQAQYLAAWTPYNAGQYGEAATRLLEFTDKYKKAQNRAEALWFAGWSAFLDHKDGLARRALEQLLEEHPQSDLRPQARYWLGRIRHRAGEKDAARAAYREVLSLAPLSYWGFWAMTRLSELGEETVLVAPPKETLAPVPKVVAMLGPRRPINVDRAIALAGVGLANEAQEELTAANQALKAVKDTAGRTMVADMLQQLGAHHLAFLVGSSITQDGGDLVTGKPYAWRAWRHAYPRAFESEVRTAAETHEVEDELILSVMRTESSFRPTVRSPVGAYGLMQIMPDTAAQIGRSAKEARAHAARYKTTEGNVWLGGWYLARLLDRYGGQLAPAIGAYNAGPGAMDKWMESFAGLELDEFVERVPYRETRRYIRRVLETYLVYRRLGGKELPALAAPVENRDRPAGAVQF